MIDCDAWLELVPVVGGSGTVNRISVVVVDSIGDGVIVVAIAGVLVDAVIELVSVIVGAEVDDVDVVVVVVVVDVVVDAAVVDSVVVVRIGALSHDRGSHVHNSGLGGHFKQFVSALEFSCNTLRGQNVGERL